MFIQRIKQKYEIKATQGQEVDWKHDIAAVLLADAVSTELQSTDAELKNNWGDKVESVLKLKKEFRGALENRIEDLTPHNVKLADYLPLELVAKIDKEVMRCLGVSLEKIWEEDDGWATSTALGAIGHGVGPFDDLNAAEDFAELGVDGEKAEEMWKKHQHFENDFSKGLEWIEAVISAPVVAGWSYPVGDLYVSLIGNKPFNTDTIKKIHDLWLEVKSDDGEGSAAPQITDHRSSGPLTYMQEKQGQKREVVLSLKVPNGHQPKYFKALKDALPDFKVTKLDGLRQPQTKR